MSAAVRERVVVRMAGVARPSSAQYFDTLGAWAGAYEETGGGLLPPRRMEPVFADPDGNPMVVRPGRDGPTAFPFPGPVPPPTKDPAASGFVAAAGGSGYDAAAEVGLARQAVTNGDGGVPRVGERPDDGGVFGELKQQIGGYLARLPAQVAQSLLKTAVTNALLGGGSGGLSQVLAGGLGALVPGLGGAAGTLGSVLGGLTNGTGPLGGVVGSLSGGCFAAGSTGIAFDSSAALSQLGGQLLSQWQVQDSDSMGEQLAHHTVNKCADQLQDPQAALDKLNGYFTGAVGAALFAAVRLTDADGVGEPVLAGAVMVFVEGLPQARVGDPVLVPGVAVYMGAATVLTEGRMSARAGTSVSQAGPFMKGAATVFINGAAGGTPPPPKLPPAPKHDAAQKPGLGATKPTAPGETTGSPAGPKGAAQKTPDNVGSHNSQSTPLDQSSGEMCKVPGEIEDKLYTEAYPDRPKFDPSKINNTGALDSSNCYAYAANDSFGHAPGSKSQPGDISNTSESDLGGKNPCEILAYRSSADGMPAMSIDPARPPDGTYPVALVYGHDASGGEDYHWYRQNQDGTWSHKPGHTEVTNLDNSNKIITNPQATDRNGIPDGGVNYDQFCGYYAMPKNGIFTKDKQRE